MNLARKRKAFDLFLQDANGTAQHFMITTKRLLAIYTGLRTWFCWKPFQLLKSSIRCCFDWEKGERYSGTYI